jgi:hypothetical protein
MHSNPFPRLAILTISSALLFATSCRCPEPEGGGRAPGVVYASTSMKCGNDVVQVGTGTGEGKCTSTEGPAGNGITCTGGKSGATAVCVGGVSKCLETEGAGFCNITPAD